MERLGSVQQKVACLFVTEVTEEPSRKREQQPFRVLATETINPKALAAGVHCAVPTEKVDGTCCYITSYKGKPYLWARLDRKPTKLAEKRFKKFLYAKEDSKEFIWNIEEDFKQVPDCWIPARKIKQENGNPLPDENGHIPGWVPVEKGNKQYCWHLSVINYDAEVALVLRRCAEDSEVLEISEVRLSDLLEQTLELIGTNINANPYGLGSKKHPIHLLVTHGAFQIKNQPSLRHDDLILWFESSQQGKVEGIVWHCTDGFLIKLHRHHLGLCWPVPEPYLCSQPVVINVNLTQYEYDFESKSLFSLFAKRTSRTYDGLKHINFEEERTEEKVNKY
ncbi:uncharacterized protein C12orf29 homolog [Rhinatrema bivittatum]|uniref:uncharacterized protein C12orf29 homolog n=1 Tax=Rhinatrema bivittatum TaxID=194408 RepID=UPI00112606FC|nr:uncharacterized protein C12orf29 homolog [Rhinatrema bivittatum]